ncbi:putative ABC transport system ATP-binding protein [Nakamurella panacisegetis]|uniref:Putative ABC transport system ATP-binding protein n=1 Tax=Nakamurella panacisegetis TaxID=1090615 RepID=A0A1H0LXI9_9ACTN|nr:ABC transporter ATP-binding protein [Nakamurella panacisegetis]SDO72857.1 putative ABC transport system ATP-binding protein [Nakamurella panacisegetis]
MTTPATTPTGRAEHAARAVGLSKAYGSGDNRVRAVDNVTVDFPRGTFTAVMGPSGSGKSTLMHCLAGLDSATSGQSFIGDVDITTLNDNQLTRLRRDRIGFVFQSFNLLPTLNARQNILLPLDLAGRGLDQQRFDALIRSLGLTDRLGHRPSELSGGQQQRVAIARALITLPDVVFADEPTGALDSRNGAALLAYLRLCVREGGQTVVMVTHDPLAASYADRVLLLADGALAGELLDPTPDTVLAALRTLTASPDSGLAGFASPVAPLAGFTSPVAPLAGFASPVTPLAQDV